MLASDSMKIQTLGKMHLIVTMMENVAHQSPFNNAYDHRRWLDLLDEIRELRGQQWDYCQKLITEDDT